MVKILIVDDEKSICETLTWILEKEGHDIESTMNFREAEKLINEGNFDLYFLDLILPGGNGIDLVNKIKSKNKDAMVIIITGYPNLPTLVDAIRCEVYDYISKPMVKADVLAIVEHAISFQKSKLAGDLNE